jgi:23S rRNA G2445 N2-methylase RlmL
MKHGEKNPDKELYSRLRTLTCEQLWEEEVPRFDRATAGERMKNVSLIRAVGVVFSESGTAEQKNAVRPWLHRLLQDPAEKIRRYAMAALPKIGAGPKEEAELLSLWQTTTLEREKKFLSEALNKIGGSATLEILQQSPAPLRTQQKVQANVARNERPSAVRMDRVLSDFAELKIHLRGRSGLEEIVRQEIEERSESRRKFRVTEVRSGLVVIAPVAPFSLADLYALRCFDTAGFVLGEVSFQKGTDATEAFASVIASNLSKHVLETFTEGSIRYRLEFVAKGHQRGAVRQIADRAYALAPKILNDARNAPWAIDIHPTGAKDSVELRPRLTPDPRLFFRQQDVPAASHPPLAACMARLSGKADDEIIWDPFCGSGLELIERSLLGGVRQVYGSDRSEEAIAITKANFAAANLPSVKSRFTCCDFRDFGRVEGLGPNSLSLIITNPPMGKRVPIRDLDRLIADLFHTAAAMLRPGGRLVFANPLRIEPAQKTLKLQTRRIVDFGGFNCRLEMYRKEVR